MAKASRITWELEVPKNISSLVPYPPGKPIEETEREYGIKNVVKLASNENPLGPSPRAIEAISKALKELHLYPDGSHYKLKKALSVHLACDASEICIGNGSNEFIDLLPRVFVSSRQNIVSHQAAFVAYKLCAQLQGCQFLEAPIDENLKVDVEALLGKVNGETRLVFLANPNNPTGAFLDSQEVEHLALELGKKKILLVLDYAYWEYVTDSKIPDPMTVFRKHPNVVLLRTFSKIYGLAGARVGYLVGDTKVTSLIEKARQPFNVSSLALIGAEAALGDLDHLKRSAELNRKSKLEIQEFLKKYPFQVFESQGNFLLVDVKQPSQNLYVEFLKRGVILRPVTNYGFPNYFRMSCGLPSENQKLFSAIESIFG